MLRRKNYRVLENNSVWINQYQSNTIFSLNEFINKVIKKDHFINSVLEEKKIFIIGSEDELKGFIKSGQTKTA